MKKIFAILAMVAMTLTASAQEGGIRVNYQGAKPTISNFVTAFLNSRSEGDDDCTDESFNAVQQALPRTGKDIIVTYWKNNAKKQQKTLKWQGSKFSF